MEKTIICLRSADNHSVVKIEKGELISYQKKGIEYIHQKGNKGWRRSDDEMFPVIGPTAKNNYRMHTKKGDAVQDQHGLLRELNYTLNASDNSCASFKKSYLKSTRIKNSKFPLKSSEEYLFWPYDFVFEKIFTLTNNRLKIDFIINSEKEMPFMLGYHPAFLLSNTGKETLFSNGKEITLAEIYTAGHNAFPVLNSNTIVLKNCGKNDLEISNTGFDNFMLWTEVDNMLCIEPISQYTSYTNQNFSEKNMRLSAGENRFSVELKVL